MRCLQAPYHAALWGGLRLPILCILQFVRVGVGTCSRHSLHHTGYTGKNTPRIVDSQEAACLPWLWSSYLCKLGWCLRKREDEIKVKEDKPPLVSQQCVVYSFQCSLCDAGYVGYTCRHLHQRIEEHKGSAIANHLREQHDMEPEDIAQSFRILRDRKSVV